jgi:ADP-ribosylation factor-like protein 8
VVDISDQELIPVAKEELHALMGFPTLAGIPLLVLGNNAAYLDKLSVDELIDAPELRKMTGREIFCYGIDAREETNLDAVLAWIMAR